MAKPKLRLQIPGIHYRLEPPELLQGILMVAVGFSTVPILQETLGMSYSAALTVAAIAELFGILHVTFGDPVVPGWIASALPLVLVYLADFEVGPDSVYAMIALQLLIGVLFVVLGSTGLAHKLMKVIPGSLKAGILFGAAIAALARIFTDGGYLSQYPLSVGVGSVVTLVVLFSHRFQILKSKNRAMQELGKYGMLPGLLSAMIVGFISGEIPLPQIEWGFIPFNYGEVFRNYSVFSIGMPSLSTFLNALPMAIAVYVIAFGEIVTAEAVLSDAQETRPADQIDFNSNRTNVIAGVRNILLALFAPFTALAGPLWAAVTVSISERYKEGPKAMKTIFGGMGSFKISTAICILLLPAATLLKPILPVALAITLLVQGYACSYIAVEQVKHDKVAAGIAGMTGSVIYLASLNWGLAFGVISYLLLESGAKKSLSIIINERKRAMSINKNQLVITIDQEYGSHGKEVGETLGTMLNIPCYSSEILTEAAAQSRISEKLLRRFDERIVHQAYDLLADDEAGIHLPSPNDFVTALLLADKALATKSCILIDHHAAFALAAREDCIHIFLHSDKADRAKVLAQENSLSEADAVKRLQKLDKQRTRYFRRYFRDWGNASQYSMSIDVGALGINETADQIMAFLQSTTHGAVMCPTTVSVRGA